MRAEHTWAAGRLSRLPGRTAGWKACPTRRERMRTMMAVLALAALVAGARTAGAQAPEPRAGLAATAIPGALLLRVPAVQTELKLTADQKAKISALPTPQQSLGGLQGLPPDQARARIEKLNQESQKQVDA